MQKIKFIPPFFLVILQRYCKLILGTLSMPGYGQEKRWHQHVEKFVVYLHVKNQIYLSPLP